MGILKSKYVKQNQLSTIKEFCPSMPGQRSRAKREKAVSPNLNKIRNKKKQAFEQITQFMSKLWLISTAEGEYF